MKFSGDKKDANISNVKRDAHYAYSLFNKAHFTLSMFDASSPTFSHQEVCENLVHIVVALLYVQLELPYTQ